MSNIDKELLPGCKLRDGSDEVTGYPSAMHVVYFHRDPETRDVMYVGEGKISRAYEITARGYDHHMWLVEKLKDFDVQDIVDIQGGNYTKEEAKAIEMHEIKRCLKEGCNLFNVDKNPYRRTRRKKVARNTRLFMDHAPDGEPSSSEVNN